AGVGPPRRNYYDVARNSFHSKAAAWMIGCELLHVDKGPSSPDFIDFRSCPSTVRRNFVNVSLAPNHFVAQPTLGVSHDTKQENPLLKFLAVDFFTDVHGNCIHGIRPIGLWITKGGTQS